MPAADLASVPAGLIGGLADAVREAGALAHAKFRTPLKTWTKGKGSPVSEADIAVDELLRERLGGLLGDCGWLSEESADDPSRLDKARVWIVDPIDGTRAFIAGLPDWTIVAALVENGRPVLAAVFAPVADHLFLATAGSGTSLNGRIVRASEGAELPGSRVGGPQRRLDALARQVPDIVPTPRIHSLALRLARVAHGELDVALAQG